MLVFQVGKIWFMRAGETRENVWGGVCLAERLGRVADRQWTRTNEPATETGHLRGRERGDARARARAARRPVAVRPGARCVGRGGGAYAHEAATLVQLQGCRW